MNSQSNSPAIEVPFENQHAQVRARFWPLALIFAAVSALPSACRVPYPDPRQPIIEPQAHEATLETKATDPFRSEPENRSRTM